MCDAHEIRFATEQDLPDLCAFLDTHWRKDHVFVRHPELLVWQHGRRDGDTIHFLIARDRRTSAIHAVNGVIALAQFDPELAPHRDVWLAIWKRIEAPGIDATLGLALYRALIDLLAPRSIGVLGLSSTAKTLYRFLGFETGVASHYYVRGPGPFRLAAFDGAPEEEAPLGESPIATLEDEPPGALAEIRAASRPPHKSAAYARARYVEHPVYRYRFLVARVGGEARCALVVRRARAAGGSALRIVDVHGDLGAVGSLEVPLRELLAREGGEYIDCVTAGLDPSIWRGAGFARKEGGVVIPDYFDPFERKNVELAYAFRSEEPGYVFFKGDGDQDRPNTMTREAET
jgi:hypothetical protein